MAPAISARLAGEAPVADRVRGSATSDVPKVTFCSILFNAVCEPWMSLKARSFMVPRNKNRYLKVMYLIFFD